MMYVVGTFTMWCSLILSTLAYAADPAPATPVAGDVSCECPKLACDPCSAEKGITFFSDRCGKGGAKVKSCARPTCVPIDVATRECPVPPRADSGPREPVIVKDTVAKDNVELANEAPAAGRVKVIQGSVAITRADGKKEVVTQSADIREGDTVESGKGGGAVIDFRGGNKVHVQAETAMQVKEYRDVEVAANRKALLNLIKGKIRNQVEQKYNGKTSYFKIQTKGAVAGVRGTDFVIAHTESGQLETRVETLGGKVWLSDDEGNVTREIKRGEGAVYTAEMSGPEDEFIHRGTVSEVYKIAPDRLAALDRDTRLDVARNVASQADAEICTKPSAKFNQCAWKCDGNPAGEKTCRTDLPQVRCVRSRCNANGVWAEEMRQPASAGQASCPAQGAKVKDCDY